MRKETRSLLRYYGMSKDLPLEMLITVMFEEHDGKTKLTLRHVGMPSGADSEGAKQGWNESFDKLAEYLETEKSIISGKNVPKFEFPSDREIVITRIFDAPRELVFKASTDPRSYTAVVGAEKIYDYC